MQFNPGSSKGIVDEVLKITKATTGKYPLADIVRRVNAGMVRAFRLGFLITGDARLDDESKSTPPISYQNLSTGVNVYPASGFSGTFTNFIKLEALDSNGNSYVLNEDNIVEIDFGQLYQTSIIGAPSSFVKVGGTFYVRPTPNYNKTNGLVGFGNRKPDFFLSSDTTKEAPYWLPEFYLARYAAQPYLEENNMDNIKSNYTHIQEDEQEIKDYFVRVAKNARPSMTPMYQNNK